MEEVFTTITKLIALSKKVVDHLNRGSRYYDPPIALDYVDRYNKLKDILKKKLPDLFSDIPDREMPKKTDSTDNDGRGYIKREPIMTLFTEMKEIIDIWNNSNVDQRNLLPIKVTREGVFFSGQYFDALLCVRDILNQARKSIIIIDGYVNEDLLSLVSEKDPSVEVMILTKDTKPAFITAATAFNKQYGKVCIRTSSAFHDRFLIIDDSDCYHFGASIKDLGNRGFMFSLIEDSFVINSLKKQFHDEWQKATIAI